MRALRNPHCRPDASYERSASGPTEFHRRLPGYTETPVIGLPSIAQELGLGHMWLKDESARLGLPAFKILGASWATYRFCCERLGAEPAWRTLDDLRDAFAPLQPLTFVTATDGNHGRAVARAARWLGFAAEIFVPAGTAAARIAGIASEGATVTVIDGNYDDAVRTAAARAGNRHIVVSDTSWEGYTTIPAWVAEGYETLFAEIDHGLGHAPGVVLVPIGVGALAEAAVRHYRTGPAGAGSIRTTLIGVEPETAACVFESIEAGRITTAPGPHTSIMAGLNCGTPSLIAWPIMRDGFDAFLAIDDDYPREAMRRLAAEGIVAGETGAACLGALIALMRSPEAAELRKALALGPASHVVVLCTEGATDPTGYEAITGRTPESVRGGA